MPQTQLWNPAQDRVLLSRIYSSGIGRDYVISETELAQLQCGISCVILLSNPEEKSARALLKELEPVNTPAPPGKKRFNVHFGKPKMEKHQMIRVNRFSVAIVDR